MTEKKKYIFLTSIFALAFILNILTIITKNIQMVSFTTLSVFISLIILYIGSVRKINAYFVVYLCLVLLSEVLFLFKDRYFFYTLLSSTISQIIIIIFVKSFKHIKYKDILYYFIPTLLFYLTMYFFVIDATKKSFMLIIFGLVNSVLVAAVMANHLKKMYLANYLLFLGIAFSVLTNSIMSIDIFNTHTNIYATITNIISHFFICISFIARVNKPKKEKITNGENN